MQQKIDTLYTEYPGTAEREYIEYLEGICYDIEQGDVGLIKEILNDTFGTINRIASKVMFLRLCDRMKGNLFFRDDFCQTLVDIITKQEPTNHTKELIIQGLKYLIIAEDELIIYGIIKSIINSINQSKQEYAAQISFLVYQNQINTGFKISLYLLSQYLLLN